VKYRAALKDQPYQQIFLTQRAFVHAKGHYLNKQYLQTVNEITYQNLLQYCQGWLRTVRFDCLAVGNLDRETAKQLLWNFEKKFTVIQKSKILKTTAVPEIRVVNIPENTHTIHEFPLALESEQNSCILSYFQIGLGSTNRDIVLQKILVNYLEDKVFDQLRTTETLGYIVWTMSYSQRKVLSVVICLQSNSKNASYCGTRIEALLADQKKKVL
jgi:secreted Zn-dependent insulinase-like peptidase